MQVTIGSIQAFTNKCVVGLTANRDKASAWLARNSIVVTALNPLIGYIAGSALVKEAFERNITIQEAACEKAKQAILVHQKTGKPVTEQEIVAALSDLRRLTEGGISTVASGG